MSSDSNFNVLLWHTSKNNYNTSYIMHRIRLSWDIYQFGEFFDLLMQQSTERPLWVCWKEFDLHKFKNSWKTLGTSVNEWTENQVVESLKGVLSFQDFRQRWFLVTRIYCNTLIYINLHWWKAMAGIMHFIIPCGGWHLHLQPGSLCFQWGKKKVPTQSIFIAKSC